MYFYGLYNSFPMYEKHHDYIYGKFLRIKKPFVHRLTDSEFEKIKEIEGKVFPEEFIEYRQFKNKKELLKKINCSDYSQLDFIVEDDFFYIAVIHYNSIYVSDIGITYKDTKKVMDFLRSKYEEYRIICKPIYANFRESTSYKVIKYFERKGYLTINDDEPSDFHGEPFHRVEFSLNNRQNTL